MMKHLKLECAALLAALFASNSSFGTTPQIHTVVNKGTVFQHFEIELSESNILLPKDIKNRERLDDTAGNFKYGQFEVFIPAYALTLPLNCKGNYIVRMPQTLDENRAEIQRKQSLYYSIKDVKTAKKKAVRVVLEMSSAPGYACNLFFRDDGKGRYVDYVGKIRY
jgi:hypothetical protein